MGGHDASPHQQFLHTQRNSLDVSLNLIAAPPILLSLTAEASHPATATHSPEQVGDHRRPRDPEAPPVLPGAHRVNRATFRTAPTFHPQRVGISVEVPLDVSVSPETQSLAPRAQRQPGPRVAFAKILKALANNRGIDYQVSTVSFGLGVAGIF